MGKIFYLAGKSSSGKDTIYRNLLECGQLQLKKLIPYTTRPIRAGEKNGREYFFTDEAGLEALRQSGKVIEERVYHTFHGPWYYFTVDDGQLDLARQDYLMIGTLESFSAIKRYVGGSNIVPLYIEVDDGERLQRALDRERKQEEPKYEEMCRRFLADSGDFSEEKIAEAGIEKRFRNSSLEECLEEVKEYIRQTRV
nr:guanylate kinase [uncultured Eisenbergiella sp.]